MRRQYAILAGIVCAMISYNLIAMHRIDAIAVTIDNLDDQRIVAEKISFQYDALNGQLLGAGIDHRVGGKVLDAAMMTSWGDVETMMRLWANHGAYNLCRLQNRRNCVPPKSQ